MAKENQPRASDKNPIKIGHKSISCRPLLLSLVCSYAFAHITHCPDGWGFLLKPSVKLKAFNFIF